MMDRLTYKGRNGKNYVKDNGYYNGVRLSLDKTADRLAAYEDTGLTPEEVDQIRKSAENMMFEKVGDFVRYAISNFEDLQKYRKAENEGRLVALPCKVGDTVYVTEARFYLGKEHTGIQKGTVYGYELGEECGCVIWAHMEGETYSGNAYRFSDFGQTVFLTREEAEQALKGGAE